MNWEPHYIGIETVSIDYGPVNLYLQRSRATKRLEFVRLSNNYRPRWWSPGWGVVAHLARSNYGGHRPGWEVGTYDLAFGCNDRGQWGVRWSGSNREPYTAYILHFGRCFLKSRADGWLQRLMKARDRRRWEAEAAVYYNENE